MTLAFERVYLGRDNRAAIAVLQDSDGGLAPVDFSGVTRMVVNLSNGDVIDSASDAGAIDWLKGEGVIEFIFGALLLNAGVSVAELIAYDPVHPLGQVLVHGESDSRLAFEVHS